jgi:hypothetical protein
MDMMKIVLKWTVFRAATSHPKTCMTKAAMVFPTYLVQIRGVHAYGMSRPPGIV